MNTAGLMVETLHRKVLAVDSDLRSGALSILLNSTPKYSTHDW